MSISLILAISYIVVGIIVLLILNLYNYIMLYTGSDGFRFNFKGKLLIIISWLPLLIKFIVYKRKSKKVN